VDLGWVDKIVVLNRQDCCQARIQCYKLELLGDVENVLYTYRFSGSSSSYTFRDPVTDAAVQQSCNLAPPPPPMQPLPSTPRCPSMVGEFVRYVRIGWADSSVSASTCGGGQGGHLNVAEMQLIYNGYNIALGKPGTALDVWSNNPAAYGPSKLVDGKSNTMFHSLTVSSSVYVQIDLQVGPVWLVVCEVCAVVGLWSCGACRCGGDCAWLARSWPAAGYQASGMWQLLECVLAMGCWRHTATGTACCPSVVLVVCCHAVMLACLLAWWLACIHAMCLLRVCCCDSLPGG
jgi:hypothetical protein